ncbi:MAG: hypothetical protein HC819_16545 [Cyclobacteriaceae bacterium]|nr:hypothetical protein [Cyclobacteriaceae bacterium]
MKSPTVTFIAIFLVTHLCFATSIAHPAEKLEYHTLQFDRQEMLDLLRDVLYQPPAEKADRCIKIYNSAQQLVYECRDRDDARLKTLIRRSDLLLRTDTSSYYLLND